MNLSIVFRTLGRLLKIYAGLFIFPVIVAILYKEPLHHILAFMIPLILIGGLSLVLTSVKQNPIQKISIKDGFIICGISWILFTVFGALPFIFSGQIPHYIDAIFETMSGFTTTGSSILSNVEGLSHSMLFWRSFSHLIGGMGVLVFALAFVDTKEQGIVHVMKVEVPGPQFGKLVSKLKSTAQILYLIYLGMTLFFIILLALGKMNFFDAMLHGFGAAGTGGFGIKNSSVAYYNDPYSEIVITIAMITFGINFNLFYFILLGHVKEALNSEELKGYLLIILVAVGIIFFNILGQYAQWYNALKDAFFTVGSIITTTGYVTADFQTWPLVSHIVLLILMFIGGCAGSTAGGLKVSRIIILIKSAYYEVRHSRKPSLASSLKFEGKSVDFKLLSSILSYFSLYMICFFFLIFLMSFETNDFGTAFSAVSATFNNIGPGINHVGATANFGWFSDFGKVVLTLSMLMGRLEIIPVLILFSPSTYKKF